LRQVGSFFPVTPVSFNNKIDRRDITELLLKVALSTITQPQPQTRCYSSDNKDKSLSMLGNTTLVVIIIENI
jgi:hypothetical protein